MLEFELWRFSSGAESTLGILFEPFAGRLRFLCFTLEDEFRTIKKFEETRIPAGSYSLSLRLHGGHHQRYERRFADFHKGMIEIDAVPGFTDILVHIGNNDDDTAGCILVADASSQNITEAGSQGASRAAYIRIYPHMAGPLVEGKEVRLTIKDIA